MPLGSQDAVMTPSTDSRSGCRPSSAFFVLGASSSASHTSKTGVIDVGSNSVNDGSSTRGSTSTGQPGHMVIAN
nr:hypothetical protein [Tanacetum cinerariifolium]